MEESTNGIRKEVSKGDLNVTRVYKSDYQKEGTQTAELKQTITTDSFYPSKSVANNLQDNIFGMADFGFEEQKYQNKETRVAWIDVPEAMNQEAVAAKLAEAKEATLYRILSNRPILSDTQQYAVNSPELNVSLDDFANRQAVRYPDGNEKAGELALDVNGKVQYRAVFFSKAAKEDIDMRTEDPADAYLSAEIKAEVNSTSHVVEGQAI